MSAPPDTSSPSPTKDKGKQRERLSSVKPPASKFEPDLPPAAFHRRQLSVVRDLQEEEDVEEEEKPQRESPEPMPVLDTTDG